MPDRPQPHYWMLGIRGQVPVAILLERSEVLGVETLTLIDYVIGPLPPELSDPWADSVGQPIRLYHDRLYHDRYAPPLPIAEVRLQETLLWSSPDGPLRSAGTIVQIGSYFMRPDDYFEPLGLAPLPPATGICTHLLSADAARRRAGYWHGRRWPPRHCER
jgi:hypothetical protein